MPGLRPSDRLDYSALCGEAKHGLTRVNRSAAAARLEEIRVWRLADRALKRPALFLRRFAAGDCDLGRNLSPLSRS